MNSRCILQNALISLILIQKANCATPTISEIVMVPRLKLEAYVGVTNEVQYSADLTNWTTLTNLFAVETPIYVVDANGPESHRFYRVFSPAPPNMVVIPPGSFLMGDTFNDGVSPNELPVHNVFVSAFYMDKYETTKATWQTVVAWANTNDYTLTNGVGKADTHPVVGMNWFEMIKWCNARSEMEGLAPVYFVDPEFGVVYRTGEQEPYANWSANGYRLPTEAEWEKAGRGGVQGHRYTWTDCDVITHSQANYRSRGIQAYDVSPTGGTHPQFTTGNPPYTSPVGFFAPNDYGLYDMTGNVWEFCWDWDCFTYYSDPEASEPNPHGCPSSPEILYRIVRGGSWDSWYTAGLARVAARGGAYPPHALLDIGFRTVRKY